MDITQILNVAMGMIVAEVVVTVFVVLFAGNSE